LAVSMRPLVTVIKDFLGVIQVIGPWITATVASLFTLRAVLHLNTWATTAYTAAKKKDNAATVLGIFWDKAKTAATAAKAAIVTYMTGATVADTAATSAGILAKIGITKAAFAASGAFNVMGLSANMSLGIFGLVLAAILAMAYAFVTSAGSPGFITILGMVALAFIGMAIATSFFGFSIAGALPFILGFAAAVLMIGLGIGIAAAGMALFVSSVNAIGTGLAASMLATAMAIREIVDAIDDVPLTKTLALTAAVLPLAAMAPVAALASAGMGAVTRGLGGGAESGGAAGASGPPAVIKVYLDVGGDKFAVAVNNVEVKSKLTSKLHQTFVDQLEDALLAKP
jgi:hypothetical protein